MRVLGLLGPRSEVHANPGRAEAGPRHTQTALGLGKPHCAPCMLSAAHSNGRALS